MQDWIVSYRRKLHESPELMYNLSSTSAIIRAALDEMSVPYQYPIAKEGLVATIGTGQAPVVALRSDMDALPVDEPFYPDTAPFASKSEGRLLRRSPSQLSTLHHNHHVDTNARPPRTQDADECSRRQDACVRP